MSSLDTDKLLIEKKDLHVPELSELSNVLRDGLKGNFVEVDVDVVECPDLTQEPFHLATNGLSGSETIVDIGGPPYLLPTVDRSKLYDLSAIGKKLLPNANEFAVLGAGAGPYPHHGSNCEGIFNMKVNINETVDNQTHIAHVSKDRQTCRLEKLPSTETRCALLANVYYTEGKPGPVVRVRCKIRKGDDNFITKCRLVLAQHYGEKVVGLGGVFVLNGKAWQHVMPDFSDDALYSEEDLNKWLTFFEMPGPLIAVGTLITDEVGLDLRVQHFHSFSKENWGGHYHYDTTPDTVEYEAYFNIGRTIVRVDKPVNTHKFGRD